MIRATGKLFKYYHTICELCGTIIECTEDDFYIHPDISRCYCINCPECGDRILKSSMEKIWRDVDYENHTEQYNTDNGTDG